MNRSLDFDLKDKSWLYHVISLILDLRSGEIVIQFSFIYF